MAATILNSPRATEVSVYVVRAFVALREMLAGNKELAAKLAELESRLDRKLASHDQAIAGRFDAMRELMRPPEPAKKSPIGAAGLESPGALRRLLCQGRKSPGSRCSPPPLSRG